MQIALTHFQKTKKFAALTEAVKYCDLCPGMAQRKKVLTTANGNIDTKVLFIAEAPGRLGADKTGIPLCGDKAGDNFEALLKNIGWGREEVFITNAVLCNPRDRKGRNTTPGKKEIINCSDILSMTIDLIDPQVVASLGGVALKSLSLIQYHNYSLKSYVGKPVPWYNRTLFPLYHPGQRAVAHRSISAQRSDFFKLAKIVHPIRGFFRARGSWVKPCRIETNDILFPLAQAINFFVSHYDRLSKFRLTKLLYLADLKALKKLGHGVTKSVYLRQADGPWPPDIDRVLKSLEGYEIIMKINRGSPVLRIGPSPRFSFNFAREEFDILNDVLERYGALDNAKLKSAAYLTTPMREILKKEASGEKLLNKPVLGLRSR